MSTRLHDRLRTAAPARRGAAAEGVHVERPAPVEPGFGTEAQVRAAYAAHGGELYRFAVHRLGDAGAAQEVVQEVFLRAWRHGADWDPRIAGLRGWLFAIARNAVIDEVRRKAARPWRRDLVDSPEDTVTDTSTPSEGHLVDGWVVEEALRRISADQREAIVATYFHGHSYAEVAERLSVPIGTLRSRVFYGLKALRVTMDEMGVPQ